MSDLRPPVLWTWRLLRARMRRVARSALVTFALWLAWLLAALALRDREDGPFIALLLLGLCILASAALTGLGWYLVTRRLRARDALEMSHLIWLNQAMQPRRPLPALDTWTANPDLLVELWRITRENRPARVLELGSGLSTVVMARALEQNQESGELVALEHHPYFARQTRRLLAVHGLGGVARVLDSPLQKQQIAGLGASWYTMSSLEGLTDVELLFVDGPGNQERVVTLFLLHSLLAETACIVIDDIDRPESQHILERWQNAFPGQLCRTADKGAKWTVLHWRRNAEQGVTRPDSAQSGT